MAFLTALFVFRGGSTPNLAASLQRSHRAFSWIKEPYTSKGMGGRWNESRNTPPLIPAYAPFDGSRTPESHAPIVRQNFVLQRIFQDKLADSSRL